MRDGYSFRTGDNTSLLRGMRTQCLGKIDEVVTRMGNTIIFCFPKFGDRDVIFFPLLLIN